MLFRRKHSRSFFFTLLWSFLCTGLIPVGIICVLMLTGTGRYADSWYKETVQKTVDSASGLIEFLIVQAAQRSQEVARNSTCESYVTTPGTEPALSAGTAYITQLCTGMAESGLYTPYLIPIRNGRPALGAGSIPGDYLVPAQTAVTATSAAVPAAVQDAYNNGQSFAVIAHPHPQLAVPLAVGIPITNNGIMHGCVITDIARDAFFSVNTGSIGGIRDLVITDKKGCIIFSLLEPGREGQYTTPGTNVRRGLESVSHRVHNGITVTVYYPQSPMRDFSRRFTTVMLVVLGASLMFAVGFSLLISRSISRPVLLLARTMRQVQGGNLDVQCPLPGRRPFAPDAQQDDITFLIEQFNDMVRRIKDMLAEAVLKQQFLRAAEVQALRSQINPHFLYNTLSSIRSMAKLQGAKDAAEMVTILARILREGITLNAELSTIAEAVRFAKDYFLIESYRWPGRFTYREHIDADMAAVPVPRLVIQPVVENALVHGLEEKAGPGTLEISAVRRNGMVVIAVSDDGRGMDEHELESLRESLNQDSVAVAEKSGASSSGIALINTHRRLRLLYGAEAGLRIYSYPGEGTCVEICYKPEESNV